MDGLDLTGEEGFVLSRLDGNATLPDVVHMTGLPVTEVRRIVDKLVDHGAVEHAPHDTGIGAIDRSALALLLDETIDDQPAVDAPADEEGAHDGPHEVQLDSPDPQAAVDADNAADSASSADGEESDTEQANYRELFMTQLQKLELVQREALARSAKDATLLALCFDSQPSVIKGIFENPQVGVPHARLVARHHRTPQGLDTVLGHEYARDAPTQRLLLQNPMLQDVQMKRLLSPRRLAEIYKTTLNRDIPERNRQKARGVLRVKWANTDGEERAGLIFTTEGRCLFQLQGLAFDSQTTMLLCARAYTSGLLVQNIARFGACPPSLLGHLAKQPVVKRQQHLRSIIKQHPNCPSEVKRG